MSTPFELLHTRLAKGTTLLEASAGTGKTYTIVGIVLRLLLEELVDEPSQILLVTFTIAATEELKVRLRAALTQAALACEGRDTKDPFLRELGRRHGSAGAARLRRALAAADDLSVSTIHAFCHRVLEEAAFESGEPFAQDFVADEIPLVAEAARDAVRLEVQTRDSVTAAIASEHRLLPDQLVDPYIDFRRHEPTVLRPTGTDLEASLDRVRALVAQLRALAAAGRVPAALAQLTWRKGLKRSVIAEGEQLPERLRQRLLNPGDPCLDWLCELAPAALAEDLLQRSVCPARDDPFAIACGELATAVAMAAAALRQRLFTRITERLQREQRRASSLTFRDLLQRVAAALRAGRIGRALRQSIQDRWRAAVIDEFQDTDPLQYEIFATCFAEQRLLLVGDPKQSIYAFRGADVHAYLRARDDARQRHSLPRNHRSHPGLVRTVGRLFGGAQAFADPAIAMPEVVPALAADACAIRGEDAPVLQFRLLQPGRDARGATLHNVDFAQSRIAVDVAAECARLLRSDLQLTQADGTTRPLRAGDLAVLTRTNAQAVLVQTELRRLAVHSAIGKAGDVFACAEMDDMQRLLVALVEPGNLPLLRAAWTTPLFARTEDDLRALAADRELLATALDRADGWRRLWLRHGFMVMFTDLLWQERVRERLLGHPGGERTLTNYLQIAELLHQAEMARQLAPESLVQWLEHERRHAEAIDYELRELRLESDACAVQILTVHGSKGLEYEVVFVPFAWHWRDPATGTRPALARSEGGHVLAFDDERAQWRQPMIDEARAEDLRLLYVALTRARRRTIVHVAPTRAWDRSALHWLLLGAGSPEPVAAGSRDFTALRHAIGRLGSEPGTVGIVDLPVDAAAAPAPAPADATTATARPRVLPTRLAAGFRVGSFTAMLRHEHADESALDDPRLDAPVATPATAVESTPTGMFAFARGAEAGVCLHAILERTDFALAAATPGDDRLRRIVRETLQRFGLLLPGRHAAAIDAEAVVIAMLQALVDPARTALPVPLATLPATDRLAEWQFFVPAERIAAHDLARCFAAHASPPLRGYAERVRRLAAAPLSGFLRGFVDLLAVADGRYWVLDWKSNWLGAEPAAYAPARLGDDMQDNHYVLQYHLYLLALHRHLRARLPGYDYDRHVGGACYVYLRALGHGEHGVFVDRPPQAMILALDDWLAGGGR